MQIVGHGIPDEVVDGLTDGDRRVLRPADDGQAALAAAAARRSTAGTRRRGRSGSATASASSRPTTCSRRSTSAPAAREFAELDLDPEIYAENIWPDDAPGFRTGVWTWFEHAGALARTMTDDLRRSPSVFPTDHFRPFTDHSIDVLRMNHYPVPDDLRLEPGQLGMGAHTDYGIVTVLWADPVPGLEILRPDGSWLPVAPAPGALLINLGDLPARWTNDRWLSTMHRVVPPAGDDGQPAPPALGGVLPRRQRRRADLDARAVPRRRTGTCYDDVTVGEHLAQKLGGSRGLELNAHAAREAARIRVETSTP